MTRSVIAGAAAALLLAAAPSAAQARDPLAGGTTTLKLDAGVAKALKAAGVKVSGHHATRSPAARSTARRHRDDPPLRQPQAVRRARSEADARAFTVKLGKSSTLSGRVGGARVTLLTLDTSKAKIARAGLDTKITGVRVALTSAAAKALNATFHTTLFKNGLRLGTVAVHAPSPKTVGLTGGATTVTLDPAPRPRCRASASPPRRSAATRSRSRSPAASSTPRRSRARSPTAAGSRSPRARRPSS